MQIGSVSVSLLCACGEWLCCGEQDMELSIEEGDLLFILDQTDANWWRAKLEDKEGLVPSNYGEGGAGA